MHNSNSCCTVPPLPPRWCWTVDIRWYQVISGAPIQFAKNLQFASNCKSSHQQHGPSLVDCGQVFIKVWLQSFRREICLHESTDYSWTLWLEGERGVPLYFVFLNDFTECCLVQTKLWNSCFLFNQDIKILQDFLSSLIHSEIANVLFLTIK